MTVPCVKNPQIVSFDSPLGVDFSKDAEMNNKIKGLLYGADVFSTYVQNKVNVDLPESMVSVIWNDMHANPFLEKVGSKHKELQDWVKDLRIARDEHGKPIKTSDGKIKWIYGTEGKGFDWSDNLNRKTTKKTAGYKDTPPWREAYKEIIYGFLKENTDRLPPVTKMNVIGGVEAKFLDFETRFKDVDGFVTYDEIAEILGVVFGSDANKWNFLSVFYPNFHRILNNQTEFEKFFGIKIDRGKFRTASETVSTYAGKNRGAVLTALDLLDESQRSQILGKVIQTVDVDGKVISKRITRKYIEEIGYSASIDLFKEHIKDFNLGTWGYISGFLKLKIFGGVFGGIDYVYKKYLAPSLYMLAMVFGADIRSFGALTAMNSAMYVSESINNKFHTVIDGDRKGFARRHYNLMSFGNEVYNLKDRTPTTWGNRIKYFFNGIKGIVNGGLFNIPDIFLKNSYSAKRYSIFFSTEFPAAKTVDEVEQMISRMSEQQKKDLFNRAYQYIERSVRNESTNTIETHRNAPVYVAQDYIYQNAWSVFMRSFDFLKGWARAKTRGFLNQLRNTGEMLRSDIGKMYMEKLTDPNTSLVELDAWVKEYLRANIDAIDFVSRFQYSFLLSKLAERYEERELGEERRTGFKKLLRVFEHFANFNGTFQAFMLLPEVQIAKTFLENIYQDFDGDGSREISPIIATGEAINTAAKNLFRGWWLARGLLKGIGDIKDSDADSEKIYKILNGFLSTATGYTYYLERDIKDKLGYKKNYPKTSNSLLMDMLGYTPKTIEEQRELIRVFKTGEAYENMSAYRQHLLYHLPFIGDYKRGAFEDKTGFKKVLDEMYGSTMWKDFVEGKIPGNIKDISYLDLYKMGTRINLKQNKRLDMDTFEVDHSFVDKYGDYVRNSKVYDQEDIINYLMNKGIDRKTFMELKGNINSTSKEYAKKAIRALMYIEGKQPGSSAVVLGYLMDNDFWDQAKKEYGYDLTYVSEEKLDAIKIQVAKKYAHFYAEADKNIVWPQFFLSIAKRSELKIADYIEGGEGSSYKISLDKDSEEGDGDIYRHFKMSLLSDMLAVNGEKNVYLINNLYSDVFKPRPYWFDEHGEMKEEYAKKAIRFYGAGMDKIDAMGITQMEKDTMKAGVLLASDRFLTYAVKSDYIQEKHNLALQKVLHHLWGTIDSINEQARDIAEDNFGGHRSGGTSRRPSDYKKYYNDYPDIKRLLDDMIRKYFLSRDFNYRNSNGYEGPTYSEREWNKILQRTKPYEIITYNPGSSGSKRTEKKEVPGGFTKQFPGYSRPKGGKTEDPDKTFEFSKYGRIKRLRTRIAKVKSLAQDWRRVNKLGGASDPTKHRRQRARKSKRRASE